jgi:hypothetical protein
LSKQKRSGTFNFRTDNARTQVVRQSDPLIFPLQCERNGHPTLKVTPKAMKKTSFLILLITASFLSGFGLKTIVNNQNKTIKMKKVTGIGGVFFKCKDPKKLTEWYQKNLGLETNPYGATFEWYEGSDSTKKAQTQWTPFPESTKYFEPSSKDFMINYRVENLEALVG